ncbi:MAG: hypothetical protein V1794_13650 [Candidatus Glassbacteria bacterium]
MSENRSQDIQLIKLAIQIEKDGIAFFGRFIEKAGEESNLTPFIQQLREENQSDQDKLELLLGPLEAGQTTEKIEDISLDDYVRDMQKARSEKFFAGGRIKEMFDLFYNPIRLLGCMSETFNELADFYSTNASNIFYDNEKKAFVEIAANKKNQADQASKKKKEIIARFP